MGDLYQSYAELAAAETEGVDYLRTLNEPTGATWASIAIHGGGIEPGTGELAHAVADGRMLFYEFDGIKASGNSDLHITSTLFDEPLGVALVADSVRTLSFHGMTGTAGVAETAVGGLDTGLRDQVAAALEAAGFTVSSASEEINGDDPDNICNENARSAGVQLELSFAQREAFFPGGDTSKSTRDDTAARTQAFYDYTAAVQSVYDSRGRISLGTINVSRWVMLPVSVPDVDVMATCSTNAFASGGPHFLQLGGRVIDRDNCYLCRVALNEDQSVTLTLRKRVGGNEDFLTQYDTPHTHAPHVQFTWRLQVEGSTLRGKVWPAGDREPVQWQLEHTDTSITGPGRVGVRSILSSVTTGPLPIVATFDDFRVLNPQRFTVTRSVNGIVKPHDAGTGLALANPMTIAL